jgi:hypothetical protein
MKTQNALTICLAVAFGFLIGAKFAHQTTVKAQSQLQVYVAQGDPDLMTMGPKIIQGSQVVGFSCVLDKDGIFTHCYTAYTK